MEKHNITWRGVEIEVTFTPEAFGMADHIELRTVNKVALPVTETGYRSYFHAIGHRGAVRRSGRIRHRVA